MNKWLKSILDLPLDRLLILLAVLLFLLSFNPVRYQNNQWDFRLATTPNLYLFVPGGILLVLFLWRHREQQPQNPATERIQDGFRLRFGMTHSIAVVSGKIEDFAGGHYSAVVLPANTSFDDQCIHDDRSALGSFFLKHFPSGINEIQRMIRDAALRTCGETEESFRSAPSGTTIFLDKPLGSAFRIMVTAVTTEDPQQGVTADTLSLISSVKQVFRLASQNRISSVTMPVMGTGHGGLDFKAALSLLLVQCMYSMQYEGYHHVREAIIVVYDPDRKNKDLIARVVQSFGIMTRV